MGLTNFLNLGKVQIGNEAAAASAINKLRAADLYLSSILSKLFRVENEFNTVATQAVAESTRKAADNEAWKTMTDAIATGLGGVFQIGGAICATAVEHFSNQSLEADKQEINTIREYRKTVDERDPSQAVSNKNPNQERDAAQAKQMKKLTAQEDFREMKLEEEKHNIAGQKLSDKSVIENATKKEAEELKDHLDNLISKKEDALAGKRNANNRKGDAYRQVIGSVGQIAASGSQGAGVYYQQAAGEQQANRAVAQSALQTVQATMNDYNSQASSKLELAYRLSEILVNISQGDVYRA